MHFDLADHLESSIRVRPPHHRHHHRHHHHQLGKLHNARTSCTFKPPLSLKCTQPVAPTPTSRHRGLGRRPVLLQFKKLAEQRKLLMLQKFLFEYVELGNFLEPPECQIEVDWTKTHGSGCICILPTVHLMYKNICTFPDNSFTFVTPERQNNRMPKHTNDIKDIPPPRIPSLLLFQTSFGFIYR